MDIKEIKMLNKEYVLSKIIDVEVTDEPWNHIVIKDFLPQILYDNIKQETMEYTDRDEVKESNIRAYHIYANESISHFPSTPYLKEYYDILLDKDIVKALSDKLLLAQPPIDFYSELNLFTQGYNYGEIHPDRSDKVITMLHYLADEGDDESIGTLMYTPYEKGNNLDVFDDCIKSAPYISNCALFFSPRDGEDFKTNHCMANKSETTFLRKSFQTFWMNEASDWTKDKQKGRIRL
tara:strand:+ start:422 stop:1129 length:708 start_codon:yes stop_codon:yes gene_type:complete